MNHRIKNKTIKQKSPVVSELKKSHLYGCQGFSLLLLDANIYRLCLKQDTGGSLLPEMSQRWKNCMRPIYFVLNFPLTIKTLVYQNELAYRNELFQKSNVACAIYKI